MSHLASVYHLVASSKGAAIGVVPNYPEWLFRLFGRRHHLRNAHLDFPGNAKGVIGIAGLKAKHLPYQLDKQADEFLDKVNIALQRLNSEPRWSSATDFLEHVTALEWTLHFKTNTYKGHLIRPKWHTGYLIWNKAPAPDQEVDGLLKFSENNSCQVKGWMESVPPCLRIQATLTTKFVKGNATAHFHTRTACHDKQLTGNCFVGTLIFADSTVSNVTPIIMAEKNVELSEDDKEGISILTNILY